MGGCTWRGGSSLPPLCPSPQPPPDQKLKALIHAHLNVIVANLPDASVFSMNGNSSPKH
ncbi:MAG: hypothetical protein R2865_04505 [Deinococcales bacterium]